MPAFTRLERSTFPFKHMDDKDDHILVEDFNISGIINRDWAQTTPKAEAFVAPVFFLDVGDYYDGKNEPSEGEELFASMLKAKGHGEPVLFVCIGRAEHRWASCLGCDAGDSDTLRLMFSGLRASLHQDREDWDTWQQKALVKYKNDDSLKVLLSKYLLSKCEEQRVDSRNEGGRTRVGNCLLGRWRKEVMGPRIA